MKNKNHEKKKSRNTAQIWNNERTLKATDLEKF